MNKKMFVIAALILLSLCFVVIIVIMKTASHENTNRPQTIPTPNTHAEQKKAKKTDQKPNYPQHETYAEYKKRKYFENYDKCAEETIRQLAKKHAMDSQAESKNANNENPATPNQKTDGKIQTINSPLFKLLCQKIFQTIFSSGKKEYKKVVVTGEHLKNGIGADADALFHLTALKKTLSYLNGLTSAIFHLNKLNAHLRMTAKVITIKGVFCVQRTLYSNGKRFDLYLRDGTSLNDIDVITDSRHVLFCLFCSIHLLDMISHMFGVNSNISDKSVVCFYKKGKEIIEVYNLSGCNFYTVANENAEDISATKLEQILGICTTWLNIEWLYYLNDLLFDVEINDIIELLKITENSLNNERAKNNFATLVNTIPELIQKLRTGLINHNVVIELMKPIFIFIAKVLKDLSLINELKAIFDKIIETKAVIPKESESFADIFIGIMRGYNALNYNDVVEFLNGITFEE